MSEKYPYPPGKARLNGDIYGRRLPALPMKPFMKAKKQYKVNSSFCLFRPKEPPPDEMVRVRVIHAVDVGYSKMTQSVIAHVDEGPSYLHGKNVFLKFYDPLYINPDDLWIPPQSPPSPSKSLGSDNSYDKTTLAGSVETSRKVVSHVEGQYVFNKNELLKMLDELGGIRTLANRPVESRNTCATRLFTRELRAYTRLKTLQGKRIAKFLGHFRVSFPERELKEDQTCRVIMLELLEGKLLSRIKIREESERQRLRQQIVETVTRVYDHNIFFPHIMPDMFLIVSADNTPRMFGFAASYDPDEHDRSAEQRRTDAKDHLNNLEDMLDELGYNEAI